MSPPGVPRDAEARWRSARRQAALRHHPDRGGSAEALERALDEVDRRFGRRTTAPVVVRRTVRGRLRSLWRRRPRPRRRRPRTHDI